MKIIPPQMPPGITTGKTESQKPSPSQGPGFGEILDKTVQATSKTVPGQDTAMPIERPPGIAGRPAVTAMDPADPIEAGLDALEAYRSALADQQTNLREVAPLLSAMDQARRHMESQLTGLPSEHPLRQIADQTSAEMAAEKLRFDSGVYV